MGKLRAAGVIGILICTWSLAVHAWSSKQDNKPVAELEVMNDPQLADEAAGACQTLTSYHLHTNNISALPAHGEQRAREAAEAADYLQTIMLVVKEKHGGKYPAWIDELLQAHSGTDREKCLKVRRSAFEEQIRGPVVPSISNAGGRGSGRAPGGWGSDRVPARRGQPR